MRRSFVLASLAALTALSASGCYCSHSADPSDAAEQDAPSGCPDPMPTDCFEFGGAGECTPVTATCEGNTWNCPQPPPGAVCETATPCMGAFNDDLVCRVDLGAGCCGAEVERFCEGTQWVCPGNAVSATSCSETSPACQGCEGLSQVDCIGEESCVPRYLDSCCENNCDPTLGCTGCQDYRYGSCAARTRECEPFGFPCNGDRYDGRCEPRAPDCTGATATNSEYCSIPGCVVAIQAGCSDDCDSCVPLNGDACTVECDSPAPDCPTGTIPRAVDGCYAGDCIAPSICQ